MSRLLFCLLLLLASSVGMAQDTRVLFSHYAPELGAVRLEANGDGVGSSLAYRATDERYRSVGSGVTEFVVLDASDTVLAT